MKRILHSAAVILLLACVSCSGGKLTKEEASRVLRAEADRTGTVAGVTPHFVEVTGIAHNDTGTEATVTYTLRMDYQNGGSVTMTNNVAKFRKFDDGSWRMTENK
jgi:hypothetical protein